MDVRLPTTLGCSLWLAACGSGHEATLDSDVDVGTAEAVDAPPATADEPAVPGSGGRSAGRGGSGPDAIDAIAGGAHGAMDAEPPRDSAADTGGTGALPPVAGTGNALGGATSGGVDDGANSGAGTGTLPGTGGAMGGYGGAMGGYGGASAVEGSGAAGAPPGEGGSQTGPVVVPTSTHCSTGALEGQLVPPEAPVVLSAVLTSDDPTDFSETQIAPTSTMDTVYVATHFAESLAEISRDGVSLQSTGVCGELERLVVDDGDRPEMFLTTRDAREDGGNDTYFALWTPAEPAWASDFIVQGGVLGGGYGVAFGRRGLDGFLDANGAPHTLVYEPNPGLYLYDRSELDSWKSGAAIENSGHEAAVVVDSLGQVRIVFPGAYGQKTQFTEWIDGAELAGFRKDGVSPDVAIAAGLSGVIGVARVTDDGIAVTFSDGVTVSDDQPLANTQPLSVEPCYRDHSVCEPLTCEYEGIRPNSVSLAATSDGAFWLSYAYVHQTSEYAVEGTNPHYCWTLSEQTLVSEARVVELSASGAAAPSLRWSHSSTDETTRAPVLAARGSRLYLAVPGLQQAEVFVLDREQL